MVASIGAVASPSQGASYYERDGYYAKDDPAHREASAWTGRGAAETRMRDPAAGRLVRVRGQKTVVATFRHDTSRNLDPLLHTHSVIANMLLGADGQWRTMANERLYRSKMLLGALYRSELAGELKELGYGSVPFGSCTARWQCGHLFATDWRNRFPDP